MLKRTYLSLIMVAISLVYFATLVFSEEVNPSKTEPAVPPAVTATTPAAPVAEPKPAAEETKWVWAEVTGVDAVNNQIVVKYLDYDTDEEKSLAIVTDNATRFENAEGIKSVAVGDNVGVDYILNDKGQALAKSIALEKAESMPKAAPEAAMQPVAPVAPETPKPVMQEEAPQPAMPEVRK